YVVVKKHEHAAAGLELVRDERAGRCGFLVAMSGSENVGGTGSTRREASSSSVPEGVVALSSVVRVNGPFAELIEQDLVHAWIADSTGRPAEASRAGLTPVATTAGDLFRAAHLVVGGSPAEARGILETKREIKDLRDRIRVERDALARLGEETAGLEVTIAQASGAIA